MVCCRDRPQSLTVDPRYRGSGDDPVHLLDPVGDRRDDCAHPPHSRAVMNARLLTAAVALATLVVGPVTPRLLTAQSAAAPSSRSNIANDPDVLGAERLFSAWLEGQIAYRGLPGVAVGVVSDQELVWASGFGFADLKAKIPMSPTTKFRM